ncbi:ATP synthase F1, gamma subunit [Blattabacterium sp. (Periplaneta americana) str. BPLAN]|uniref:ATP synthase F1 subunit gamma n=1 Tax=Blattabacterium sp. (Periplaneta americana) TaxID=367488 RepID=UPI0001BA0B47|nr:ATP synthase F1 subunit gamma [Blattabacterium sp. (Periplaneta americana)]ACX83713.1 ATP synthase F1, gamma subunit [Blattabacterium sp. (Periplaneta americana) str. BPLAN]
MSNPKEIKKRILSIDSVVKTTEAMKMISIVKLRKSKELLLHIKRYSESIEQLFQHFLLSFHDKLENIQDKKYFFSSGKKKLFIVITSNRGLCGAFNSLIFDKIHRYIQENGYLKKDCIFFSIGKKGFDFLSRKYNMYKKKKKIPNNFTYKDVIILVKELIEDFFSKKFHSIYLIYNHLKNSFFQEIIIEQFLPIIFTDFENKSSNYSILEPSKEEILDYITPKFLSVKLFKSILESSTSEHTARMMSMHKATESASDIKKNLMLNYNKERQTSITKEILEIISGLEALSETN